ncbi:MAG: hypothetical protein ACYC3L_16005 [Gemmatimonadaceae bacterium]
MGSWKKVQKTPQSSVFSLEDKSETETGKSNDSLISHANRPKQAQEGNRAVSPTEGHSVRGAVGAQPPELPAKTPPSFVLAGVGRHPIRLAALRLRDAVLDTLEAHLEPRATGRRISLSRRSHSLLATHARFLAPGDLAAAKRLIGDHLPQIALSIPSAETAARFGERDAALKAGMSVRELLAVLREREIRRLLLWPRPIGRHVYFLRGAFDPDEYPRHLAQQPLEEPWHPSTWPKEWRS